MHQLEMRKSVIKLSGIRKSVRKLKGIGDFLGSRPRNQENPFRKSKEIYREKVKTYLVELTIWKISSYETDCHVK